MVGNADRKAFIMKPLSRVIVYAFLLIILIFTVMPIFWIIIASLKTPSELNYNLFGLPKEGLYFQNIIDAWYVGRMNIYFLNSIIVAVPRVLGVLCLSTLAGYAFAKLKFFGKNVFLVFMLCGMMVPIQSALIPLFFTMANLKLINTYAVMIVPFFGFQMPFGIFIMRAFFRDLPNELMDAAVIDGSNMFQTFARVMLPLAKPGLLSLLIFEFMWAWKEYMIPMYFVYLDNHRTLPVGLQYFQNQYTANQSLIAAAVTISSVPIIIIFLIFQRKFISGITAGSVKG